MNTCHEHAYASQERSTADAGGADFGPQAGTILPTKNGLLTCTIEMLTQCIQDTKNKESALADCTAAVDMKDAALAQQTRQLKAKDAALAQLESKLVLQAAAISAKETELAKLAKQLRGLRHYHVAKDAQVALKPSEEQSPKASTEVQEGARIGALLPGKHPMGFIPWSYTWGTSGSLRRTGQMVACIDSTLTMGHNRPHANNS